MKSTKISFKIHLLLVFFLINKINIAQSVNFCKGISSPINTNSIYVDACPLSESVFDPRTFEDTITINVVVYALNNINGSGELNNFSDSTFYKWIENTNHLLSNLDTALINVPGTEYIKDTKIRLRLLSIIHTSASLPSDNSPNPENGITGFQKIPNTIGLILSAGQTGNGFQIGSGGYAVANLFNNEITFLLNQNDIFNTGHTIHHRYKWLAHEMGHILGLTHTGSVNYANSNCNVADDNFDDTYSPDHMSSRTCSLNDSIFFTPNFSSSLYFCGMGAIPNNIMGYSCETYFSPKQIYHMRARLVNRLSSFCLGSHNHPYCNNRVISEVINNGEELYDSIHVVNGDLFIETNSKLIVTGCLIMSESKRIIVAPGATLIVNGGVITTKCVGKLWGGIEVRGSYNQKQTYSTSSEVPFEQSPDQGICIIKNNAKIERANVGVFVGGRLYLTPPNSAWDLKLAGGILQVDNSNFINCNKGVVFSQYNSKVKSGNKSYIKNSVFSPSLELETISDLFSAYSNLPVQYSNAIELSGNDKILITGNSFKSIALIQPNIANNNTSIGAVGYGIGINAVNSELFVRENTFISLKYGIKANNTYTLFKKTEINNNKFFDNLYAITGNLSFGKINNNYFRIPDYIRDTVNLTQGASPYPWGVFMDNCHTFLLQNDTFITKPNDIISPESIVQFNTSISSYGLIIKNSGNIGGEVKNNCYFKGLNIATQTELNNPNLQIRCNNYENNNIAWRINPLSINGVLGSQGTSCMTNNNSQYRANNKFLGCSIGKDKFESYLNNPFNYYYWDNNIISSDIELKPCTTLFNNSVILNPCFAQGNDPNLCPNSLVNVSQLKEIREKILDLILADQDQEALKILLENVQLDEVKMLLIAYYYDKDDIQNMQQYINQLSLNKLETKQFRTLYTLFRLLKVQSKTIYEMNKGQIKVVEQIAETPTRAGSEARSILEILKLKENNNIPELPIILNSQSRMDEHSVQEIRQPELGQNIPNPAENKTSIKIFVPDNLANSYISIVNAMGQLITTRNLNTGDQLIEFNIMDFETGIYFYTLYINAIPFSTKRMVIVK